MSRTYKKEYTKSKRFTKSCRCNGGCPYCLDNRMKSTTIHREKADFTREDSDGIEGIDGKILTLKDIE